MDVLNRLSNAWNYLSEIVIYGFGRVALRNIKKLKKDFNIKYIVDNNPNMQLIGNNLEWEIKNFEQAKKDIGNYKIIVATAASAYESIKKDLMSIGLREYEDFCRLEEFLPEWYWKNRGEVCISQVTSSITSRCTFRCKNCGSLMPYFKNHYDYIISDIVDDLSLFFERADYLAGYYLVGGEPFLNEDLGGIVNAIYDNFQDKIGYIQVISNGSVLPNARTLDALKRCNVNVRFSDYTSVVPYHKKFMEVKTALRNSQVDCSIFEFKEWLDLGFPSNIQHIPGDSTALREHMLRCSTGCHALNDKKFYYCGTLFFAEKAGLFTPKDGDFINLQDSSGNSVQDKTLLLKYCLGDIQGGYVSLCEICRGYGRDNTNLVRAAEQMRTIHQA